ncbi:MAG: 16S rRNA (cytosine(1402)-N(4))-methyltransferase RsmH, partial [Candidatus Cloacimonadaceae bacterium]|nr:16S rRNA (cytosine(1402)-N(4))-methyltransferase RsmH [Candidatus Cloacimonadaceae bacterium]
MSRYHIPVMVQECIQNLNLKTGGVYVDATLGGGGHSLAMLGKCPEIQLLGFDQDKQAINHAGNVLQDFQDRITLIHANFRDLRTELALRQIKRIDGILFDLGVSSHQIDMAERGFSFEADARLDMRMDQTEDRTAYDVVNGLSANELTYIFKRYGEELYAKRIALKIVARRLESPINKTRELSAVIDGAISGNPKDIIKSKARIFQAIRIYLNDEIAALEQALIDAINILAPKGRIVVMSYHSLEDRVVKQCMKQWERGCDCPPQALKCICGKQPKLRIITSKPVLASETE